MRVKFKLNKNKILPAFHHLIQGDDDITIEFLYGTRDSGKSKGASQAIVLDSLKIDSGFKGILIRKVKENIKDSNYATVNSVIKEWKLSRFFSATKSPLEIASDVSDNVFICRGMDEPERIKSLENPTHALIEEGDQLSSEDFTTILTTLRHNKIKIKVYFLFNPILPKGIAKKEDWWLYRDWFSHTKEKSFVHHKKIQYIDDEGKPQELELKYRATHSTFEQNPFCPPSRKAFYYNLQTTNMEMYLPYAKGEWGNRVNKSPFFYMLGQVTMNTNTYIPSTQHELLLSFDFNHSPTTCIVAQRRTDLKKIIVFDVILGDINTFPNKTPIQAVCQIITQRYGHISRYLYRVTGDQSGTAQKADRLANVNFFTDIVAELKISKLPPVLVVKANLEHSISGSMCNDIMSIFGAHYEITGDTSLLQTELQLAFGDENRSLWKFKKDFGGHMTDSFRYLNTNLIIKTDGLNYKRDIKTAFTQLTGLYAA